MTQKKERRKRKPDKNDTFSTPVSVQATSSKQIFSDNATNCNQLQQADPSYELISDIGSGLNWKRRGLLSLLDAVCGGFVQEVVVTDRDRLARFGFELLEWLFRKHSTKLVVLCPISLSGEGEADVAELRDDLLAIVTFFVARNNGRRSARNRKQRRNEAYQGRTTKPTSTTASVVEEEEGEEKKGEEEKQHK